MRARELGRKSIVVGDRVGVVGTISADPDTLVRIVRLDERDTVLRRTADDNDPNERVIVANADQLVIVSALAEPDPSFGLIDRCLVAALTRGHRAAAVLDQSRSRRRRTRCSSTTRRWPFPRWSPAKASPLDELREHLRGQVSVFVGHSGVGKSTLINALVPDADRATGTVSAIGKGRHTSSSAVALRAARRRRMGDRHARACARSGWRTSAPTTCCGPSPTSRTALRSACPGASTSRPRRAATSTRGLPRATPPPARLAAFRQLLVSR